MQVAMTSRQPSAPTWLLLLLLAMMLPATANPAGGRSLVLASHSQGQETEAPSLLAEDTPPGGSGSVVASTSAPNLPAAWVSGGSGEDAAGTAAQVPFLTAASAAPHCRLKPAPAGGVIADCRNAGLTQVPRDLPNDTVFLDLGENELTRLHNSSFLGLTSLRSLLLDRNKLALTYESFPPNVFRPLTSLEVLDISGCESSGHAYPEDIFLPLGHLTSLTMDLIRNAVFGDGFSNMPKLQSLQFRFDGAIHLYNDTFAGFSRSNVTRLEMSNVDVRSLGEETFCPFQQLTELLVRRGTRLRLRFLFEALKPFRGRTMSLLNFDNAYQRQDIYFRLADLQAITAELSAILSEICVSTVILSDNFLQYIDFLTLQKGQFVDCVRHLDVSRNHLALPAREVFWFFRFSQLEYFDLSPTSSVCPEEFPSGEGASFTIRLPPKLMYFSLAQVTTSVGTISNITVLGNKVMKSLNVSCVGLTAKGSLFGLAGLETLDLAYNNLSVVPPDFFQSLPSLTRVLLRHCHLDQDLLVGGGRALLRPLVRVRELDLADNGLRALPPTRLPALETLDVSGNSFTDLPLDPSLLPRLRRLHLAGNALTFLTPEACQQLEEAARRQPLALSLEDNPLSCHCGVLPFLAWLSATRVRLSRGGNYSCLGEDGVLTSTAQVGTDLHAFWWRCHRSYVLSVIGAVLAAVLVSLVLAFFLVKFKTHLRRMAVGLLGLRQMVLRRQDYKFDVFLAYTQESEEDLAFVVRVLRQHLVQHGLRVFLMGKDDRPGFVTAEEIVRGVTSSWRVLFVLTPAFLQDEWCLFMVNTAVRSVNSLNPDRVLLLFKEDVALARLPASLLQVEAAIFRVTAGNNDVLGNLCRALGAADPPTSCLARLRDCWARRRGRQARDVDEDAEEYLLD